MKRFLTILVLCASVLAAICLVTWIVLYVSSSVALSRSSAREWPSGLGTVDAFPARHPTVPSNAAATRLLELAEPLAIDFRRPAPKRPAHPVHAAMRELVTREHVRPEVAIGEAPPMVGAFLDERAAQLDAVRDHLLASDIVWATDLTKGFDEPVPNLLAHMQLGRMLAARALLRARNGDAESWRDLEAASRLSQSIQRRPELITQLIALAIARIVNGVAWKLPLPAPQWLDELSAVDHGRLLGRALQHEAWMFREHGEGKAGLTLGGPVGSPYIRLCLAGLIDAYRDTVEQTAPLTVCAFDGKRFFEERMAAIPRWNVVARVAFPTMESSWSRALRYRAEREATKNALRLRAGQPLLPSRCSDAQWVLRGNRLSLSREIPGGPKENVMPLSLVVKP